MFVAISLHWSLRPALLLAPPYLGFSMLMYVATRLLPQEAHAARVDERLRIMQGLHDSLGHRLTAMNINLEIAAHSSPGEQAATPIRTAQILGRAALAEIRALVQEDGDERDIDLEHELQQLTADMPRPKLHLQYSSSLAGLKPEVARILLQSVQEVTTNAIRHGAASNLWIEVGRNGGSVKLLARDDGQGTADIQVGFGLAGIQRRVEARGGTVSLGSSAGHGFEVRLEVPLDAVPQS
jgi:signal transduction histidine kinase